MAALLLFLQGLKYLQTRLKGGGIFNSGQHIKVFETYYVDPKTRIILFEVDGLQYLAVISPQSTTITPHAGSINAGKVYNVG